MEMVNLSDECEPPFLRHFSRDLAEPAINRAIEAARFGGPAESIPGVLGELFFIDLDYFQKYSTLEGNVDLSLPLFLIDLCL